MLTNFQTIKKTIARMQEVRRMSEDGSLDKLPKKEKNLALKDLEKMEKSIGGIKTMTELPNAIFVVDTKKEHNAIMEARKLGVAVVGIVDTNCDPDEVDYIIPGNDDAIRAVRLIVSLMADSVLEGAEAYRAEQEKLQAAADKEQEGAAAPAEPSAPAESAPQEAAAS